MLDDNYYTSCAYIHIKQKGGKVSNAELYRTFPEATEEEIKEAWREWFSIPKHERERIKAFYIR